MRWMGDRESDNVEDRRGIPAGGVVVGGGIGTVVIFLIAMLLGADPRQLLQQLPQNAPGQAGPAQGPDGAPAVGPDGSVDPRQEELRKFVAVVLADTEDVWDDIFESMGKHYVKPKLVLFSGQVDSACGMTSAAVGPFYCPGDSKVYIDLTFYEELRRRFKAPGEFAQAYVIAHEVGHHIQNLLGRSAKVEAARRAASSEAESNDISVRTELQADFYAGVWANHAQKMKNILEPGDIESALNAAAAIGDDAIEKRTRGYVVPDSFTHGSSEQRVRWFRRGFESGDVRRGDTFDAREL